MRVTMTVDYDGSILDIKSNLWSITEWERKYNTKFFGAYGEGRIGMEDLAYLAYQTLKSTGHVVPALFDDFRKKCQAVELVAVENIRPTEGAQSDDS